MMTEPLFRRGAVAPQAPTPSRPNRYAGKCTKCGGRVEAGEGNLTGNAGSGWTTEHVTCPEAVEDQPYVGVMEPATLPVAEGRYTVVFADGTYKTLRVRRQDEDSRFMPGLGVISYLSGSNNDTDYTGFANFDDRGGVRVWKQHSSNTLLREALKVLIDAPAAAAMAYAEASNCCSRCGRTLTVPASLHAGYGPECARKMGL